jgi:hypothetical protein
MIAANNLQGWAQSGLLYDPTRTCWMHFAQQKRPGYLPQTNVQYCVTFGVTHQAWQRTKWNATKGMWSIQSMIDTTPFLDSSYDPTGAWSPFDVWSGPFIPQFFGETHHNVSDVPGYTATRLDMSTMLVQDELDDTWHDTCGYVILGSTTYDPAHRYATDAPSCNHVRIWTSG